MKRSMWRVLSAALVLAAGSTSSLGQVPQSTEFTYQGQLTDNAQPANGQYDLQFELYSDAAGTTQVGSTFALDTVQVTNGLFTAALDFGAQFNGEQRWLKILVRRTGSGNPFTAIPPLVQITAAPVSLFAMRPWEPVAGGVAYPGGVAVGTASAPQGTLDVRSGDSSYILMDSAFGDLHFNGGSDGIFTLFSDAGNNGRVQFQGPLGANMVITNLGLVGIGTTDPQYSLHVTGHNAFAAMARIENLRDVNIPGSNGLEVFSEGATGVQSDSTTGWGVFGRSQTNTGVFGQTTGSNAAVAAVLGRNESNNTNAQAIYGYASHNAVGVMGISEGNDGMVAQSNAANRSGIYAFSTSANGVGGAFANFAGGVALKADGLAQVKILQILGGSDVAEPFDVAAPADGLSKVEPGMVVVIDTAHPGDLALSSMEYDSKVAGVISGANGLAPGMVLRAEGQLHADGQHPVAMSGRVWVWCDAAAGAIAPGDRLTTSATPGHAMRADDRSRSDGAVIGKAMTELKSGKGLVLVLVNLQ